MRIELCGDLVESLRSFDPDDQRTVGEMNAAWIAPARESILTPETSARAREVMRSLCDAANVPSTRARRSPRPWPRARQGPARSRGSTCRAAPHSAPERRVGEAFEARRNLELLETFDRQHDRSTRLQAGEYVEARGSLGESVDSVSFESFVTKLRVNEANLKAKYQCSAIRFKVIVKGNTVTLKPVPIV